MFQTKILVNCFPHKKTGADCGACIAAVIKKP